MLSDLEGVSHVLLLQGRHVKSGGDIIFVP